MFECESLVQWMSGQWMSVQKILTCDRDASIYEDMAKFNKNLPSATPIYLIALLNLNSTQSSAHYIVHMTKQ